MWLQNSDVVQLILGALLRITQPNMQKTQPNMQKTQPNMQKTQPNSICLKEGVFTYIGLHETSLKLLTTDLTIAAFADYIGSLSEKL
jgi:hypothetical protein